MVQKLNEGFSACVGNIALGKRKMSIEGGHKIGDDENHEPNSKIA